MQVRRRRLLRLSPAQAFWSSAVVLGVVLAGSAMVSPLYHVYQEEWHFSSASLTAVFAVYALAVLAVLLVAGSLSDHIGRRPMMAVALAAEAGAAWLFLSAHGIGALYGGRVLQGVATAGAASAAGAALLDLQPSRRPTLASTVNATASSGFLAMGALGAGILVQYAAAPTRLVFWVLFAASLAGLVLLVFMAEPGGRRPLRWAVLRPRAGVPPVVRRAFLAALPALVATWGLGGLYFSLVPSLTEQLARSSDTVWGGAAIFLLCAPAALAGFALRRVAPGTAMVAGCTILAVGSAATVGAIIAGSTAGLLLSTVLAGIGFGLGFLGAFRHLAGLAPDDQRGALVATIYIVSYLAFSLPVIAAGVAATHFSLRDTAIVYGAAVTVLAAMAAAAGITGRLTPAQSEHPRELVAAGRP